MQITTCRGLDLRNHQSELSLHSATLAFLSVKENGDNIMQFMTYYLVNSENEYMKLKDFVMFSEERRISLVSYRIMTM